MSSMPTRPEEKPEVLEADVKRVLLERLATVDEDAEKSMDPRKAMAEMRPTLKHIAPR